MSDDKRWVGACGIGIGILANSLDFSMVNTGIPAIQAHFGATLAALQWIMTGLGVAMTALLVTAGRSADLFGRKRIYLLGLLLFALSVLLCGLAPTMLWLIIGRVLEGISFSIVLPVSLGLIVHQFPASGKGKAIAFWSAVIGVGLGLGPLIGGLFISYLSWRFLFFVNLPIIGLSLLMVILFVRESRDEQSGRKIDPKGVLFLIVGTGSLVLGIVQGPVWGWSSLPMILLYGLAAAGFIGLAFFERRARTPILPIRLFLNRMFFVCTACNFTLVFCLWAVFFLVPIYLSNLREILPLTMGLMMLALAIPYSLFSLLMGNLAEKTGPKRWLLGGFGLWAVAAAGMSLFSATTSTWWILLALLATGATFGTLWPAAATFALSTLPKRLAGVATGSLATMQELGGTLGVAISGTLFRVAAGRMVFPKLRHLGITVDHADRHTIRSLLADPTRIQDNVLELKIFEPSVLLNFFQEAFSAGFSAAMWLLAGVGAFSFLLVLVAMKGGPHPVVHPEDVGH
ncbi:MAG: DHA2 family efflux MFS transporter permease subunit [Parachlamydiales bacterium]